MPDKYFTTTMDAIGVLTGDIINSSKIEDKKLLIDTLNTVFKEVNSSILNGKAKLKEQFEKSNHLQNIILNNLNSF